MLKTGSDSIGGMFIGSDAIAKAYLGSDLVFDASGGSVAPTLPYDTEIEYIQTSGTQYIDTGIIQNARNFELTLVVQWTGSTSSQFESFFAFMKNGDITPRSGFHKYNGKWMYGTNATNTTSVSVDGNKHTFFITSNATTQRETFYIDGTLIMGGSTTSSGLPGNSITYFLGCRNRNGSTDNPCYAKFYSLNFKKFGEAAHTTLTAEWNFIPVRVGQVGYMYETVGEQLYGNSGTGSFTLGNDITT